MRTALGRGERMKTDVVVVGGGPAGLSAAIEMGSRGVKVVVVDDHPTPGGKLLGQLHEEGNAKIWWKGKEYAEDLIRKTRSANVQILSGKQVWGLEAGWKVHVSDLTKNEEALIIRAECILLATGAVEKPVPLPGWTLPGVISIGAAQVMTNVYGVLPGKRVIVAGIDILSLSIARAMKLAGADVVGIFMLPKNPFAPHSSPISQLDALKNLTHHAPSRWIRGSGRLLKSKTGKKLAARFYPPMGIKMWGIPIYLRHSLQAIIGQTEVESVSIAKIDVNGGLTEKVTNIHVDCVCLSGGLTPLYELAATAGCKFVHIEGLSGVVPLHNRELQTNIPNLFVAGNITGIESAKVAMSQGRLAGLSICKRLYAGAVNVAEIEKGINHVNCVRATADIQFHPKIIEARLELERLWKENVVYS
jgi:sarcosine oxidase, subunit alpha